MDRAGTTAPTVETIAKHAGVSTASVSRVLNGIGARPDTVRKVTVAATELGYVPNSVARSLRGGRSGQIAFAMEDIGNPVYVAMVRGIQAATKAEGYRLLLQSTAAEPEAEIAVLRDLAARHTEGLILSPIRITEGHLTELRRAVAPVVVIGSVPDDIPVDKVTTDSGAGVALAVEHLLANGRSRIAFLNGPLDTVPGHTRHFGYVQALARNGIPLDERLIEVGDFQLEAGTAAAHQLLRRTRDLDAIFCANDLIAIGALSALRSVGLRVPEDVAVVGMDDTELCQVSWPTLTSVSLGSRRRGELAAQLLLNRLGEGAGEAPQSAFVAPELMIRESTWSV